MMGTEVNISSYPATRVAGLFFHSRAVIFKSGCFVQKYWSGTVTRKMTIIKLTIWIQLKWSLKSWKRRQNKVLCDTVQIQRVSYSIVHKKRFFWGSVQKYYYYVQKYCLFWGPCRNITIQEPGGGWILVQGHFWGMCRYIHFWRNIHLCSPVH